jgi:DNA-binding CsgD family transcriptional regulator/tetratricopeptide (TPR) repeat protein
VELITVLTEASLCRVTVQVDTDSDLVVSVFAMPRSERTVPLLGRGRELEELVGHIGVAARGQLRLALVQGEPGIGKSRLLDEALSRLTAEGFSVGAGQGEELGLLRPMGPILHALGVEAPPPAAGEVPEAWRYRVLQLAIDEAEAASGDGPVLLVVDDLQWADRASLVFLRALATRVTGRPIGVVAAFRPVPRDPEFIDFIAALVEAGGLRVALGPLDDAAVRALVEVILGTAADGQLLDWTRGAGGNPLFVTELVRSAEDARRLTVVEDRAVLSGAPPPRALSILLDRRIAGLTPETADVLKVAAVLGDGFAAHILAAVMGRSTAAALPALDEAIQLEVLFSRGPGLVFRHDLVREAVYQRIPTALRGSLHLEAARVLAAADAPADVVAAHLLRSGEDPAAVAMLRDAAERLAGSAAGAAADLLDRALELMPAGHPDRASTAVSVVRLLAWAGRPAQAAARAEDALAAGLDAATEARLRVGLAEAMIFRGLPLGVLEQLARARRLDNLADAELAPLLAAAAHARLFTGQLDVVEQDVRDAVAAAERVGDEASACFALLARAIWLRSRGLLDDSLRAAEEAVARADNGPVAARHRHPRLFLAPTLFTLGRVREADANYLRGRTLAEQLGSVWSLPAWSAFRALLLRSVGRWDEAVAEAEAAIQLGDELELPNVTPMAYGVLADIAAHRDDLAAAWRYVELGDTLRRRGVTWTAQFFAWGAAAVHEASGDHAGAVARLVDARVDAGVLDLIVMDHGPGPRMVGIMLATGEQTRAERICAVAEAAAQANPSVTGLRAGALHCRGLLADDPARLAQAAAEFGATEFRPAWSAACEDAGVASVAQGDRAGGVELLEQAREIQLELEAVRDVARVEGRLRELGIRRRPRRGRAGVESGWGGLTPAEMRIAKLVAEGLSNPEIAQRLFISRHTVESHLKHIFTKLQIGSRVELATLAIRSS